MGPNVEFVSEALSEYDQYYCFANFAKVSPVILSLTDAGRSFQFFAFFKALTTQGE
jgi:hypothetical protein